MSVRAAVGSVRQSPKVEHDRHQSYLGAECVDIHGMVSLAFSLVLSFGQCQKKEQMVTTVQAPKHPNPVLCQENGKRFRLPRPTKKTPAE